MTNTLSRPPTLIGSHYRSDRGACGFVLTPYSFVGSLWKYRRPSARKPKFSPLSSKSRRDALVSVLSAHYDDSDFSLELIYHGHGYKLSEYKLKAPLNSIHITALLLLVSTGASGISADTLDLTEDQAQVLRSAASVALSYVQGLPDFICTQVTHRDVSGINNASGGTTGIDVAPIQSTTASSSSIIEERLTFFGGTEEYVVVTIDGRKAAGARHLENDGAISAGEFGTAMRDIFDPQTHAVFNWEKMVKLHGKQAYVFTFYIPKEHGAIVMHRNPDQQVVVSYSGRIFVDAGTTAVMRITSRLHLPPRFPVQMAERLVDYKQTTIAGKTFNLPSHSEVRMQDGSNLYVNRIDFRDYHKFVVDSTIHYDGSPQN